jgi:hypothetical protein
MTKHDVSLGKSHKKMRSLSRLPLFLGATLIILGLLLTVLLRANAAPANIEVESGTLSSAATAVTDTSASSGHAVAFGASAPSGGRTCPPLPAYPDANCTGVLPGVTRTAMASTTITQNGAVIQNVDVSGRLTIDADNVVIKNIKLTTGDYYGLMIYGNNTTITDSTFIGTSENTQAAIASVGGTFSATRVDISGTPDGITMGDNSSLTDSYIHDLGEYPSTHNDGINSDGHLNVMIIHNTILNSIGQTSAATIGNQAGPASHVTFRYNWVAGGGYTIYGGLGGGVGNAITVDSNVFSRQFFPNVGFYGLAAYWDNANGNTWTNNKYDNGTAVPSP